MYDSKGKSFFVDDILSLPEGPSMRCIDITRFNCKADVGVFEWGSADKKGKWFASANKHFTVNQDLLDRSKYEVN